MDHKEFGVTQSLFLEWRSPRFGHSNPTRMDNPVWEWLIHSRIGAYQAGQEMGVPSFPGVGPTWCFDRFGQTSTELPDGRTILISGEHEDYYDPDFCIYNDVVVINRDKSTEIYGYPEDIFPPTDFHTSTLLGNSIIIIGSLGYRDRRQVGMTSVYVLDLESFEIQEVSTTGPSPGWIHKHQASLSHGAIRIEKGKLYLGENRPLIENIDDWQLDPKDWRWARLTERRWTRWELKRADHAPNHLWRMRQAVFSRNAGLDDPYRESIRQLAEEIGMEPDIDLVKGLYSPDIAHRRLPQQEHNVFRISIEGVTVRYVEDFYTVQVTVEGSLPDEVIETIRSDLLGKFSLLENSAVVIETIQE